MQAHIFIQREVMAAINHIMIWLIAATSSLWRYRTLYERLLILFS